MAQEFYPSPPPDLTRVLEGHLASALPPAVAVDLVLSEVVVRAVEATLANSGALALLQGDEMVCRAATGALAPCLGAQLSTSRGLSGACVRTGTAQSCGDTETDPRVDSEELRGLGIRSMLAVPVFDEIKSDESKPASPGADANALIAPVSHPQVVGVLEVCSPLPDAFSPVFQTILERFAQEASEVRRAAARLNVGDLVPSSAARESGLLPSFDSRANDPPEDRHDDPRPGRQPYEAWTLILGALVIFAAGGISFMFGTRVGWLGHHPTRPPITTGTAEITDTTALAAPSVPQRAPATVPSATRPRRKQGNKSPAAAPENTASPASSDLVVYEKGKVIFRMKSAAPGASQATGLDDNVAQGSVQSDTSPIGSAVVPAGANNRLTGPGRVWLSPQDSQSRLVTRTEPAYPVDALAARRSGDVVLEIRVAEDGSVSSARVLRGDALLSSAAVEAVRGWRYQPYISDGQPVPFETSVTVSFSLPE